MIAFPKDVYKRQLKLHVKDFLFKPRMYPRDMEEAVAKVLDSL